MKVVATASSNMQPEGGRSCSRRTARLSGASIARHPPHDVVHQGADRAPPEVELSRAGGPGPGREQPVVEEPGLLPLPLLPGSHEPAKPLVARRSCRGSAVRTSSSHDSTKDCVRRLMFGLTATTSCQSRSTSHRVRPSWKGTRNSSAQPSMTLPVGLGGVLDPGQRRVRVVLLRHQEVVEQRCPVEGVAEPVGVVELLERPPGSPHATGRRTPGRCTASGRAGWRAPSSDSHSSCEPPATPTLRGTWRSPRPPRGGSSWERAGSLAASRPCSSRRARSRHRRRPGSGFPGGLDPCRA